MAPTHPKQRWTVVIPIRDPRTGKSRLGAGPAVNAAIALDTLTAVLDCGAVQRVLVVTDRLPWISDIGVTSPKLSTALQRRPGLTAAIAEGVERAGSGPVAVMLGDLPLLTPADLEAALTAAAAVPLGMVPDHCGTGTTLITARSGADHRPCFGENSAALHRGIGYTELAVDAQSPLRLDVDTPEDLAQALQHGAGPATRRAFELMGALAR